MSGTTYLRDEPLKELEGVLLQFQVGLVKWTTKQQFLDMHLTGIR